MKILVEDKTYYRQATVCTDIGEIVSPVACGIGDNDAAAVADLLRELRSLKTRAAADLQGVTRILAFCERELLPPAVTDEAEGGDGDEQ